MIENAQTNAMLRWLAGQPLSEPSAEHPHPVQSRTVPIVLGSRGYGKTTATCVWLLADPDNRIIVVPNEDFRRHTMRRLADLSGKSPKFWEKHVIRWDSNMRQQLQGIQDKEIFIDQADIILRSMLGPFHALKGVTWDA